MNKQISKTLLGAVLNPVSIITTQEGNTDEGGYTTFIEARDSEREGRACVTTSHLVDFSHSPEVEPQKYQVSYQPYGEKEFHPLMADSEHGIILVNHARLAVLSLAIHS